MDGAELRLHLGTCCAGPLCCSCPGLQMFASSRSCKGSHTTGGVHKHGHTAGGTALTPRPGAELTASLEHILHPGAAECQSFSAPTATRLRLLLGDHWRTSGVSTGMCQGLFWKPWALSWRGKEQRGVQSPVPHPDHSADCPQPHLHTLSQHRSHSEMTWEGPLGETYYPDPHRKGWGGHRALGGLLMVPPPTHARRSQHLLLLTRKALA